MLWAEELQVRCPSAVGQGCATVVEALVAARLEAADGRTFGATVGANHATAAADCVFHVLQLAAFHLDHLRRRQRTLGTD